MGLLKNGSRRASLKDTLVRCRAELHSAPDPELSIDAVYVALDRAQRYVKPVCNLAVAVSRYDECSYFPFSLRYPMAIEKFLNGFASF